MKKFQVTVWKNNLGNENQQDSVGNVDIHRKFHQKYIR
jgi:hypothetical protein